MGKSVGFRRDIKGAWFDDVAALRVSTSDVGDIRKRLDDQLATHIPGPENRAITIQILLRIWAKPAPEAEALYREAVARFAAAETAADRIWLHYGLTLLAYPFFRDAVVQAGLILRRRGHIGNALLKGRIIAEIGQLGSLENASKAVMFALRQWGAIVPGEKRGLYAAGAPLATGDPGLEAWFVRCALQAHRADGLPVGDLLGWPALFPFQLSLSAGDLRRTPYLELQRQGGNIDIIRAVP
ncbi:MAG: hypothetical protein H0V37_02340 [Chloroflexia bacterium]|nr:hypothetical protein [Chloroflexia bacterium]